MQTVTPRLSPQRVEVETGDVQFRKRLRIVQHIQSSHGAAMKVSPHFAAEAGFEKLFQTSMAKAPNHLRSVMRRATVSQLWHYSHGYGRRPQTCTRLAVSRSQTGRILIEGYSDDVAPLSERAESAIAAMPDLAGQLKDELSIHTTEREGIKWVGFLGRFP